MGVSEKELLDGRAAFDFGVEWFRASIEFGAATLRSAMLLKPRHRPGRQHQRRRYIVPRRVVARIGLNEPETALVVILDHCLCQTGDHQRPGCLGHRQRPILGRFSQRPNISRRVRPSCHPRNQWHPTAYHVAQFVEPETVTDHKASFAPCIQNQLPQLAGMRHSQSIGKPQRARFHKHPIRARGYPRRFPRIMAATRPATPALMCTTVPPAKSSTPISPSQPPPQTQ